MDLIIVYVTSRRSSVAADKSSTTVSIGRNASYARTSSHSTSGAQAIIQTARAGDQSGTGPAAEYSRIGPSYVTTINSRRQQPAAVAGRNKISAGLALSERYELSEAHLTAAGDGDDGANGVQGEVGVDYDILQNYCGPQCEEHDHEEYSHLQY